MNLKHSVLFFTFLSFLIFGFFKLLPEPSRIPASNSKIALSSNLELSYEQIEEIKRKLSKIDKDKVFYHWTTNENAIRWSLAGKMDGGEMDYLNTPTGDRQVYGPGYYLAESPTSSRDFGNAPVKVTIPKGSYRYDPEIVANIVGRKLNYSEQAVLGSYIPMFRQASGDWYVVNHADLAQNIRYAGVDNVHFQKNLSSSTMDFYKTLWNGGRDNAKAQHLESLLNLAHYMDGISYVRALNVNPRNPWSEFDPQDFEEFRKANQSIIYRSIKKKSVKESIERNGLSDDFSHLDPDMGIVTKNKTFGTDGLTKEQWAKKQVDEVLPNILSPYKDKQLQFRNEGIRAGGSLQNNQFKATNLELSNLKANPYVDVEIVKIDGENFLVNYFYPDAFHYEKIKNKLSPSLLKELSSVNPDELMNNHQKRQNLNERIIKELITGIFEKYHGIEVDFRNEKSIDFYKELMSIHPFDDKNGRGLRLYFSAAHLQSDLEPGYHALADLDILTSSSAYRQILEDGSEQIANLRMSFFKQRLLAHGSESIDYSQNEDLMKIFHSFKLFGDADLESLDDEHWKLIEKRHFVDLFDRIFSKEWRYKDSHSWFMAIKVTKDPAERKSLLLKVLESDSLEKISRDQLWSLFDSLLDGDLDKDLELFKFIHQNSKDAFQKEVAVFSLKNYIEKYGDNKIIQNLGDEILNDGFVHISEKPNAFPDTLLNSLVETSLKNPDLRKLDKFSSFLLTNNKKLQTQVLKTIEQSIDSIPIDNNILEFILKSSGSYADSSVRDLTGKFFTNNLLKFNEGNLKYIVQNSLNNNSSLPLSYTILLDKLEKNSSHMSEDIYIDLLEKLTGIDSNYYRSKIKILDALDNWKNPKALDIVKKLTLNKDSDVQAKALEKINKLLPSLPESEIDKMVVSVRNGELSKSVSYLVLVERLKNNSPRMNDDLYINLLEELTGSDSNFYRSKIKVLDALDNWKNPKALDIVKKLTLNKDSDVQAKALEKINKLLPSLPEPEIDKMVVSVRNGELSKSVSYLVLVERLKNNSPRMNDDLYINLLEELTGSDSNFYRSKIKVLDALDNWKNPKALDIVKKLTLNKDSDVQAKALEKINKLLPSLPEPEIDKMVVSVRNGELSKTIGYYIVFENLKNKPSAFNDPVYFELLDSLTEVETGYYRFKMQVIDEIKNWNDPKSFEIIKKLSLNKDSDVNTKAINKIREVIPSLNSIQKINLIVEAAEKKVNANIGYEIIIDNLKNNPTLFNDPKYYSSLEKLTGREFQYYRYKLQIIELLENFDTARAVQLLTNFENDHDNDVRKKAKALLDVVKTRRSPNQGCAEIIKNVL